MLPFAVILLSSGRDDCISAVGLMLAVPSDAYVVQGQGIQNRTFDDVVSVLHARGRQHNKTFAPCSKRSLSDATSVILSCSLEDDQYST